MQIYTLNVGQGQLVVVVGVTEAFIVDTHVTLDSGQETEFVVGALAKILKDKHLAGLIVTGFDADHFCEVGMKIVLNKYRPDWLMYPKYFKETDTAKKCFAVIDSIDKQKEITRHSILLGNTTARFYYKYSKEFYFEVFSPHSSDMNSSNNCSIVCKVVERSTKASYLITGDTENDRWDAIVQEFGAALKADVLAAPHHGSENGITEEALELIQAHTTLISAGVNNKYGHPHKSAMTLFNQYSEKCWRTNFDKGQSLRTVADGSEVNTYLFKS